MKRIGIFGGTYNPPHLGHLKIALEFAKEFELSKVLIIPTYTPPHKTSKHLASAEDRLNMCRLTFSEDVFEISDLEIERKGKSYTYDTLKELKEENKDAEFYFLVGDDMLLTLHEWNKPEEILELCTLVSAVRQDNLNVDDLIAYAKENYKSQYDDNRFMFLETNPIVLSSTDIRNNIRDGKSIEGLVSDKTADYIKNRRLYHD